MEMPDYILDYENIIKNEDFDLTMRITYLEKLKNEEYLKQFICDHKFFFSLYYESLIRGDKTIKCFTEGFVPGDINSIYNEFAILSKNLYFPNASKVSFVEYKERIYTDKRLKKEIKSLNKKEFITKVFHGMYKPSFEFRCILRRIRNNKNLLDYCEKMQKKTIMEVSLENI